MSKASSPNIILIFADDLGYGDISCMNPGSGIHTENVDRIAAEGLRLTDCHAASALCTPSRYSLMTGRYDWRSRLKSGVLPGQSFPLLESGRLTIASLLKKQGYRTAAVGKWHLGLGWQTKNDYELPAVYFDPRNDPERMFTDIDYEAPLTDCPNQHGFDYFYGIPASLDQPPYVHIENDHVLTPPDHMIGVKNLARHSPEQPFDTEYGPAEPGYDAVKIVPDMDEKVLSLVDEYADGDAPFFIYYPTPAVHGPLLPEPAYQGKSGLNAYADFVLQLDGFVGRLMDKLDEKGIADDTILIFTSDNGCSPVADFPALIAKGHNPSYIYRGWKADIWEGGHRIPFVVRWPGHIPEGIVSDRLVCLTDLFATFAEITGADYGDDAGEDSVSLVPLFEGRDVEVRDTIVSHAAEGMMAIRKGPWKLELGRGSGGMRPPVTDESLPKYQLYQLAGDVTESYNLYGSHEAIEKDMLQTLYRYVTEGRSTPGAPQENVANDVWPGLEWMEDVVKTNEAADK